MLEVFMSFLKEENRLSNLNLNKLFAKKLSLNILDRWEKNINTTSVN